MKLSKRSEYACLALTCLAEGYGGVPIKMSEIVKRYNIPKKYLEQILLQLKNAGIVRSSRGSAGGYTLAKHPAQITLADIIRLIDGALAPVSSASIYYYEQTPLEQHARLLNIFKDIRDYSSNLLERTTFENLLQE